MQALNACQGAMVLCHIQGPGQPIVYANPAFLALTGYTLEQVLGRNCAFLHGPDTEPDARAEIRRAVAQGEKLTTLVRNYRSDGSAFWNRLSLEPLFDEQGELTHYIGMQEDAGESPGQGVGLPQPPDAKSAALDPASRSRSELELRNALATNQFRMVYQPQVHLSTGKIVGFEALLRWQHPVRGAVEPTEFIPQLERCGMAAVATRWVIEQSVFRLRGWEDAGHRGLLMAVNTPSSVFETEGVDTFLLGLLARHQIARNQFQLELTERSLMDASPDAVLRLHALRRQGVSVAIDDFGTGYSSLSSLTRLPIDCLKLDLSFVQGAVANPSDALVARMTCDLASALKLRVVAEGIETEGQLQFFTKLRCELAQGHLFSRPLEAAAADALLSANQVLQQGLQPVLNARHLLLLDDEPNILRALRRVFRGQAWTVHIANTPDEAFELLARQPMGVVMSDQRMPIMRGTDFLARVKQLYPDTVRIILSGYTELQSVTEAINDGAIFKFLTKPWNDVQMNAEVELAFLNFEMMAERRLLQQRLSDSNKLLESRLRQNADRLQREEVALDVSQEAFGVVPVPIFGIDASGMIVISNLAADMVLGHGASIIGESVNDVLAPNDASGLVAESRSKVRLVQIGNLAYEMRSNPLGATSRGRGTVITLLPGART